MGCFPAAWHQQTAAAVKRATGSPAARSVSGRHPGAVPEAGGGRGGQRARLRAPPCWSVGPRRRSELGRLEINHRDLPMTGRLVARATRRPSLGQSSRSVQRQQTENIGNRIRGSVSQRGFGKHQTENKRQPQNKAGPLGSAAWRVPHQGTRSASRPSSKFVSVIRLAGPTARRSPILPWPPLLHHLAQQAPLLPSLSVRPHRSRSRLLWAPRRQPRPSGLRA